MPDDGYTILDDVLAGPLRARAVHDVRTYFDTYTGRMFERLDGGGDEPAVADVVMSADVVAVSMLSIRWDAAASLELLGARRQELSAELSRIPHTPIDEVAREVLEAGGPADRAWRIVFGIRQVGRTTAGKVLSRKRPHLIPVFDSVVNRVIGAPSRYWLWWYDWFSGPGHADAVRAFRADVGGIDDISMLRCLDVALWMHGQRRGLDAEVSR